MKYFPKEFLKADNNSSLSKRKRRELDRKFKLNSAAYKRQLEKLQPRLSKQAWDFFWYGFGETGLHDGGLLSLETGDGLDYVANGKKPFRCNYQNARVRMQFLNFEQVLLYTFDFRQIRKLIVEFPSDDPLWNLGKFDNIYTYELTAAGKRCLRFEVFFTSGAIILVEFDKLVFTRKRINRRYPEGAKYS